MSSNRRTAGWALLLLSALGLGCAGAKPYQATFNAPVLKARDTPQVTKDAVTILVQPITRENMMEFPDVVRIATWRQPDPGAYHPISVPGGGSPQASQVQTVQRSGPVSLIPLPSFLVRIANQGKKPVSFARAQYQLQDNMNRGYAPISDPLALKGRFQADINGQNTYIANDRSLVDPFLNQVQQLPLLNSSVVIPPGGNWGGYLVFDTPTRDKGEYSAFLGSIQSFILRLEGVSTANSGTTGDEFAFVIDKASNPIAVTCPGDVKEPSLEKCEASAGTTAGSSVTRPGGPSPK